MNKKKLTMFLAGLLALVLIVGSWAYYTSTTTIDNELHTLEYGNRTVEEFTPEQDWEPGETVDKSVGVVNTGDYPLVVRVKLDESWSRNSTAFQTIASTGKIDTVVYTAAAGPNPATWVATQTNPTDGATNNDETVVYKLLQGLVGGAGSTWVKGTDGYYYFRTVLTAGETTAKLLESITLASNVDLGVYVSTQWYSTVSKTTIAPLQTAYDAAFAAHKADPTNATKKTAMETALAALETAFAWVKVADKPVGFDETTITYKKGDNVLSSAQGYANADYVLKITTEVCQATKEAVDATWTIAAADAAIVTAWGLPSN